MHKKVLNFFYIYKMLPVAILIFLISALVNPGFLSKGSISAALFDIAIFGFLFIGQALVVLTAGIDLSMGSIASTATVIAVWVMIKLVGLVPDNINILISFLSTILVCGIIGFMSGIFISYLKITPLIATLGTSWITLGIGYVLLKGNPTIFPIAKFSQIFTSKITFIPVAFILLIILIIILLFIMNNFKMGRSVYAVGGNVYAAYISGIKVNWIFIWVYTISSIMSAIAGIFIAGYSKVGFPRAATGYELIAIASVIMGGIPFTGGEGNLLNGLFAVFVLRFLNKLIIFSGLSGYIEGIILGFIILITLLLNSNINLNKFLFKSSKKI